MMAGEEVVADPSNPSFFYTNPAGEGLSYEQLKQRRAVAAAIASRARPYPTTIGQGIASLGESVGNAMYEKRTEDFEARQRAADRAARAPLPTEPPRIAPPTPHPAGASLAPSSTVADYAVPAAADVASYDGTVPEDPVASAAVGPGRAAIAATIAGRPPSPANDVPGPAPMLTRMAALNTGTMSDAGQPGATYGGPAGSPTGPGASMAEPPVTTPPSPSVPPAAAAALPPGGADTPAPGTPAPVGGGASRADIAATLVAQAGGGRPVPGARGPTYGGTVRPPYGGPVEPPASTPPGESRITEPEPLIAVPQPLRRGVDYGLDTPAMQELQRRLRTLDMSDGARRSVEAELQRQTAKRDEDDKITIERHQKLRDDILERNKASTEHRRTLPTQRSEAAKALDEENDRIRFGSSDQKKALETAAAKRSDSAKIHANALPELYKAIELVKRGQVVSGIFADETRNPLGSIFPNLPGRLQASKFMTDIGLGNYSPPIGSGPDVSYKDKAAATEEYTSLVSRIMAQDLKAQFGGNPSDKEGALAAQQAGLNLNLEPEAKLRILMNIKERMLKSIQENNTGLSKVFNRPDRDEATLKQNSVEMPIDPHDIVLLQNGNVSPERFEQRYGPGSAARHMPSGPRGR